jgi:ornithine cyclodeaminase/alanine dehydrogenase-like protein (mu-crystallin family)
MRLICEEDVERLIDPKEAIASAAQAYRDIARGDQPAPGRLDLPRDNPPGSVLLLAGHGPDRIFCTKTNVHAYPDPALQRRDAASMTLLWDGVSCAPLALLATNAFNDHRTAAGLAAAADKLAPQQAKTLVVFGAGKLAPAVVRYLNLVRPFTRVLIVGRRAARAKELAAKLTHDPEFAGCEISPETDADKAASAADVIVTVTTATEPVFAGKAVKPGSLVILAGANRPTTREADDDLIRRATIYVDVLEPCLTRAGDLRIPLATGALKPEQIAGEIGKALDAPAARGADITVFKSMGVITQDMILGRLILKRALERSVGVEFDPQTGRCGAP